AAIIASAMPVLPEVGSTSFIPGFRTPRSTALRIIDFAGRSLTEPPGLVPSSFAYSFTRRFGCNRVSSTTGVFPTRSRIEDMKTTGERERTVGALRRRPRKHQDQSV